METENVFKWKHYQPDIIVLTVRWYLRYNLSFRNLVEMMEERGLFLAHTAIMRWVHQYGPELDKGVSCPSPPKGTLMINSIQRNGFWCKERIQSQKIMRIPTGIILYAVNPNN
ncbi:hypothetical protein IIU_06909 [Bacillus cereus VD133]|uniref:Transposase n=1 Tax=Bacillus cereus VD133 TaxID=1053233 RepID=A0A9W5UYU1_BACCE|nr:hypothetical protein IIU_06909 [Bacillus cereus VD133]